MDHEHSAHHAPRTGITGPRLQLPRFQMTAPSVAQVAAPVVAPVIAPTAYRAAPAPAPAPIRARAAAPAPAPAPPRTAPPAPRALTGATMYASPTVPATTISWDRLASTTTEPTLLQRITPVHMGAMLICMLALLIVTSGPAAMQATSSLSPVVSGGGTDGSVNSLARASAFGAGEEGVVTANGGGSAAAPAAVANTAAAQAEPPAVRGPRMIRVGSAKLPATIRHGGIPSPAASANLAIAGGGRVAADDTSAIRMNGIPSAAAAAGLGPEILPMKITDGVTLPRTEMQRDSHAQDSHYAPNDLAMETPVAAPAMTPGQSAAHAELLSTQAAVIDAGTTPSNSATRPF